jgi:4-hydroxythreonine-4-phosphate dehydrogenase
VTARFDHSALPLALTMGEPSGIGVEITLKAWRALNQEGPSFVYIGPIGLLRSTADKLKLDVPTEPIKYPAEATSRFASALPVLDVELPEDVTLGEPSTANAGAVIQAIEMSVKMAREKIVAGVVTNPIQKAVLQQAGFAHPGHTEFLQVLAGPGFTSTMMLVGAGDLRVVPVTVHQSLRSAIEALTKNNVVATALAAAAGLKQDFGIVNPRVAVAGLNPHAGEAGTMGDEESRIIEPALDVLRRLGCDVTGPFPPDTMFTPRARAKYDVAVCMYHDQALIPLKALDVDGGVNVTLGLPFVRTSPDHGTALDIAGKGIADAGSLIAALRLAAQIAAHRKGGISA